MARELTMREGSELMASQSESVLIRAQRMVAEQAGCSIAEALTLLVDTAEDSGVELDVLAECVLPGQAQAFLGGTLQAAGETFSQRSLTEADYLRVLGAAPDAEWNAETLTNALQREGKRVASIDAVRTALGRLQAKGHIERVRHGFYRLATDHSGGSSP